jgi:hypothetical protein
MSHINRNPKKMKVKQKETKLTLSVSEVSSVKSAINILIDFLEDYKQSA